MVVGTIVPNEDRPMFIKKIAVPVTEKGEGLLIIGGDFNCILKNRLDRLPVSTRPQSKMARHLTNMMKELGLVDVWQHQHPKESDYTFMALVHGSYSRIDLFCVPRKDVYRVKETVIKSITLSDHSPLIMKINLDLENHFRHWRLNVSLLTNIK